jgi:hypothetical protein
MSRRVSFVRPLTPHRQVSVRGAPGFTRVRRTLIAMHSVWRAWRRRISFQLATSSAETTAAVSSCPAIRRFCAACAARNAGRLTCSPIGCSPRYAAAGEALAARRCVHQRRPATAARPRTSAGWDRRRAGTPAQARHKRPRGRAQFAGAVGAARGLRSAARHRGTHCRVARCARMVRARRSRCGDRPPGLRGPRCSSAAA